MNTSQVTVYTDGSSLGNPGPGGLGVVLQFGLHRKEISKGFKHTTNNRMELLAVILALETIKEGKYKIVVYSDSKYVVDAINKKWIDGWVKKNFAKKKNPDLWRRFLLVRNKHDVNYVWVKGHAGNIENERCDVLAVEAANNSSAQVIDRGYEDSVLAEKKLL